MIASEQQMNSDQYPFDIIEPHQQNVPFVLNSPHSGRYYPREFLNASRLTTHTIRSSEDFLVDDLYAPSVMLGIPMLNAVFPRAYLDVNREPYELDQAMFLDELPAYANTRSIRVSSGLGTIARIVSEGQEIYATKLDVSEALDRIECLYKPYHACLRHLLAKTHVQFGHAVLLDCHSMPSNSSVHSAEMRPDIILGDRFGSSCAPALTHNARNILRDMGYHVELNKPYAGGFITEHYGRPGNGMHALQIEVNRELYMNETTLSKSDNFEALSQDLYEFVDKLIMIVADELVGSQPLAAE